ncbi:MAG TPA: BamA/TamA family outer membrane protein [Gemmatimonadaceae bacterium]
MIATAATATAAVTARAQDQRPRPVLTAHGDTASVVAGPEYRISGPLGWLDRWLFGARYRVLWTDTLRVPVLDLRAAGALRPLGADTLAAVTQLRLADSTHADYTFRLTDPRLSPSLPHNMRSAEVVGPLQDLVSALHPGAPFVAAPLARAVGLREASPTISVLPYDSALGAYVGAFGGQLGYLRDDPTGNAADAITTATLAARLDSGGTPPVDERAFLLSRLFDVYVGQAHFAPGAQRWRVDGGRWRPVPLGNDLAFARFDGLLARLARVAMPMLTVFNGRYPHGLGESNDQLDVDRRFLGGLAWVTWDSVARAMQAELTDSSIEAAVGALPTRWNAQSGAMLVRALEMRRDHLPAAARSLYAMVATRADVYVPDDVDSIVVERMADGALDVVVPPDFHRRFLAKETKEVRLFLGRRRPVVLVRGTAAHRGASLRVITGSGGVIVIDSSDAGAPRLTVNDSAGTATVETAASRIPPHMSHDAVARAAYAAANGTGLVRPVDGARYSPFVWFAAFGNLGLLLGGGVERTGYEGDYAPYRTRQSVRVGYAVAPRQYAVQYHGDFRFHLGSVRLYVDADRTGFALLRFYGLGNNTLDTAVNLRFYTSSQVETKLAPSLAWHLASGDTLAAGVVYKRVTTDTTANNFINRDRPFGWPTFQELGVQFAYLHDTRDSPVAPRRGVLVTATGKYFPGLLDANGAFGGIGGTISTYWSPIDSGGLTIAARAGAQKIWGPYPAFEAAFIGGEGTVAGLPPQRYAGDASTFGTLEARVRLITLPFVLRWDFGVTAIVDAGRVYVSGERSNTWHRGIGGGVWFVLPARTFGLILDVVTSEGNTRVYGGTRFSY